MAGDDTVTQLIVQWGDGLTDTYSAGGAQSHVYERNGWYTITVDLVDEKAVGAADTVPADLVLDLDELDADFYIETYSGSIKNDIGPEARRSSEYGPGRELRFTSGGGGARVSIESFSGSVKLRAN